MYTAPSASSIPPIPSPRTMPSAPAMLLPGVRVAVSRSRPAPASAGAAALSLRLRPAQAHLVLAAAARRPPRSVSMRCAPKTGSFVGGGAPAPAPTSNGNIHGPALDALKRAAADAFRPLLDNFDYVRSLKNIGNANDYNIGMLYGVAVAILGCYHLLKMAPWTFLDVVLGYLFYKLSVVSAQVHRQGFANDFITMIKAVISIVMVVKLLHSSSDALGFLRMPVLQLYFGTFYCYMIDWKEDARYDLTKFFEMLQVKIGGRQA